MDDEHLGTAQGGWHERHTPLLQNQIFVLKWRNEWIKC